eukprot:scaffold59704_cov35-Cyclotella_meneghiniana.AAC.3
MVSYWFLVLASWIQALKKILKKVVKYDFEYYKTLGSKILRNSPEFLQFPYFPPSYVGFPSFCTGESAGK